MKIKNEIETYAMHNFNIRGFVYATVGETTLLFGGSLQNSLPGQMFANTRIYLCLQSELKEGKHKQFNILHSTFHSLQNTHFPIVKLPSAVYMSDYLSEQAVLCGTRNTRPFSSTQ
jgi:hypothetical protein